MDGIYRGTYNCMLWIYKISLLTMHVPADCDCPRILRQHGTQDDRVYQYMYVKEHCLYMMDVRSYI